MEPARLRAMDLACRRGDRLLFRGLSFELGAGEALQIAGPNGTGKSSLLRIIAGLLPPYAGTVAGNGGASLLDERLALDEHLPLGRALGFWHAVDGRRSDTLMARLGLEALSDVPVRFLSTGQRKRAAILVSAAHGPRLWLLDEPLNGLDAEAAERFQDQVADYLGEGGMAVIASHQPFRAPALTHLRLADFAP
jgi:heme exporter protein A